MTDENSTLDILVEEYKQIRAEINLKQRHIHALTGYALVIIGVTIGGISPLEEAGELQIYILVTVPVFLACLGLLFAYEGELMAVASGYIHTTLRTRIAQELGCSSTNILSWEDYKSDNTSPIWLVYDLARWLLFILPSSTFLTGYHIYASSNSVIGGTPLAILGAILNMLLVVLFIRRLLYKRALFST